MKIRELQDQVGKGDPIYIYGIGTAGKWICNLLHNKIQAFIDTDLKKCGQLYNGIPIISDIQAREELGNNAIIIISVIDIQDVLDRINLIPHASLLPLGLYLSALSNRESFDLSESLDFINYSLQAVELCHKGYYDENSIFLRSVDVVITEKCSLKCKDCSNLMQYYDKPENIDIELILSDFQKLINKVDHIFEVRLIGGEPFMNKDIYKIIDNLIENSKITKIVIYTNLMIPLKFPEAEIFRNSKVVLSATDYGSLAKNTNSNYNKLLEMGVPIRLHPPENWTNSGIIQDFSRTNEENEKIFFDCCGKNLLTLSDGKLYRCPFAANADRLNAVPKNVSNFFDLSSNFENLTDYTKHIKSLPACNYCNGRSFDSESIIPAIQTKIPLKYISFK
jgi:organic radical activating enzyme